MKLHNLFLFISLLRSGFSSIYADDELKKRHEYLEFNLLHVTKDQIQDILNEIKIPENLPFSLDELKACFTDDEDSIAINKQMIEFYYIALQNCENDFREDCYFNELLKLYESKQKRIMQGNWTLERKRSTVSALYFAYLLSYNKFQQVLLLWKD